MEILLFTKYLSTVGGLSIPEAADRIAAWRFDGADLTVREGGYVEPENVTENLPAAIEVFEDHGVPVPMITTEITDATELAERVFATAEDCGIEYLKLGYWSYDGFGTLESGLTAMADDLDALDELAKDYDVVPVVHGHSGNYLSADGFLLADLLSDLDIAPYPDLGHLAIEGGLGGWQINLEHLAPQSAVVGIKDYGWNRSGDEWSKTTVPIGDGLVDWEAALKFLKTSEFEGPLSLHAEYDATFEELAAQIQADRDYVHEVLNDDQSRRD